MKRFPSSRHCLSASGIISLILTTLWGEVHCDAGFRIEKLGHKGVTGLAQRHTAIQGELGFEFTSSGY